MRQVDFEDAMRENHPCRHLATILKYICDKYDMTRTDFLVLLEIVALDSFTWEDFATAQLTAPWDKRRFYRWKEAGLVKLHRAKDGKFQKYNIYKGTRLATTRVLEFYDLLSGKKQLPDLAFDESARYSSNRLVKKINKLKDDEE